MFTWGDEDNEGALITVDFAEHDGGTRLTLHLTGPAEMVTEESGIQKGWNELLDSLGLFVARRLEPRGSRQPGAMSPDAGCTTASRACWLAVCQDTAAGKLPQVLLNIPMMAARPSGVTT